MLRCDLFKGRKTTWSKQLNPRKFFHFQILLPLYSPNEWIKIRKIKMCDVNLFGQKGTKVKNKLKRFTKIGQTISIMIKCMATCHNNCLAKWKYKNYFIIIFIITATEMRERASQRERILRANILFWQSVISSIMKSKYLTHKKIVSIFVSKWTTLFPAVKFFFCFKA